MKIKSILKQILPKSIYLFLKKTKNNIYKILFHFHYTFLQHNYRNKLKELSQKDNISVVFFVIQSSVWKCDDLYLLFEKDPRFKPTIVIAPYILAGKEMMLRDMNQAYNYFLRKGYNVLKTYDENSSKWLNVKKEIAPDIVIFTNPYKGLTKDEYYINNWLDCLTCYIPYFYDTTSVPENFYNTPLINNVWAFFADSQTQKEAIMKVSACRGKNVVVTGFAGFDCLLNNQIQIKNETQKVIIWSPHHSIEGFISDGVRQSCFLELADFMLTIPDKYKDINFIFKPHPLLLNHLYCHPKWGKEKADNYYKKWQQKGNCKLELGDYVQLFKDSDAMIHDCGSFRFEYLTVNNPCLYCLHSKDVLNDVNSKTKKMFNDCYYLAYTQDDIINFIESVIIKKEDKLKKSRDIYIKEHIKPPYGHSANQNIYEFLTLRIFKTKKGGNL